ncbi:helix-turn-helix domain-containing protein [Basilea psittacipulmonis]|uniref:helix-turn-helix domain-containing protein n=2 Tax=Basilea psittacipulmonis TaxID=1472345 RepID=UPI00068A8367|nr:helix-turn-helix domain-containing protein [Basilea psittacipulmonis]
MSIKLITRVLESKIGDSTKKLILLKLADNANDEGYCYPSYADIARQCEVSRRTVIQHIKQMQALKMLTVFERKTNDGRGSNVYQLHPENWKQIPSENIALGGEKIALGGENFALGGENFALGGENSALGGENFALGGENSALGGGEKIALGGENFALGGENFALGGENSAPPNEEITQESGENSAPPSEKSALGVVKILHPEPIYINNNIVDNNINNINNINAREKNSHAVHLTPVKNSPKKSTKDLLVQFGITGQLADDFIAHRKSKITETALRGFENEAQKAGLTTEQAIRIAIERGWQGFKASWNWQDSNNQSKGKSTLGKWNNFTKEYYGNVPVVGDF